MAVVTFEEAEVITGSFLSLLASMGISPMNQGRIEAEFLSVTELLDAWLEGLSASKISEDVLRTAAGMQDFAAKVLAARALPEFLELQEHLKLIGKGEIRTRLSQMDAGFPEDTSRKLVELYVACLAIHCGNAVTLDHPSSSKGDNPDVMFDYGGARWAIAIKAVSSRHGQTLFENILKASQQIDASDVDHGIVLLNVRDSLDYRIFNEREFASVSEANDKLEGELLALCSEIERDRPRGDWDKVFNGKTRPPIVFMAHTLAIVNIAPGWPLPTTIKKLMGHNFGRPGHDQADELTCALNHFMQTILLGNPGPPPS